MTFAGWASTARAICIAAKYDAPRRVDNKIDRSVLRRVLDRGNDRLGVLEVDVPGDREAEKTAPLLTMDHCDNSGAMLLFNCPDRLGPAHGVPPPHKQRLQRHERNHYEEY